MRGIVELEVLHAIQRHIGDSIPIRSFFDLIVGTRFVNCTSLWIYMVNSIIALVDL
jgi:hypothetical protein